jgi:NADH:ubiquinone oxidoreductase subunit F (NADH-binding)
MQMAEILTDITEGRAKPQDIDLLLELGEGLKLGSLCAFGRTAPQPVISGIERFREEYEAHVKHKQCPAKICEQANSPPAA